MDSQSWDAPAPLPFEALEILERRRLEPLEPQRLDRIAWFGLVPRPTAAPVPFGRFVDLSAA